MEDEQKVVEPEVEVTGVEQPETPAIEPEQPKPSAVQKRIDRLVREREDERRRADKLQDMLEKQLESRKPQQPATPAQASSPPSPEQFSTYEEYVRAESAYAADLAYERRMAKEQEQRKRTLEERRIMDVQQKAKSFHDAGQSKYEDFADVFDPTVPVSDPMAEAILESEYNVDIAYYLGKNREEATTISRMTPLAAARAIGKIEARIERNATAKPVIEPKRVSKAPDPVKPLATSADSPTKDPDDMSVEEWLAHRNKQLGRK